MVDFFHPVAWFHGLDVTKLKAVESEPLRVRQNVSELVAIQLNESFGRSTIFIGHNTWPRTIIVDNCF